MVDGDRLANLQNGRYFTLELSPGEHVLSARPKFKDEIGLTIIGASVSYVRGEWVQSGAFMSHIRFSIVDAATAKADIQQLKRGDEGQIKNRKAFSLGTN